MVFLQLVMCAFEGSFHRKHIYPSRKQPTKASVREGVGVEGAPDGFRGLILVTMLTTVEPDEVEWPRIRPSDHMLPRL